LGYFARFFRKQPLTGAPALRRQKTYSAQSGYVYQYYFAGRRPNSLDGDRGTEYVFDVSADRKTSFPVSVFVMEGAVRQWETGHGRELTANERYAIAKLSLFNAFDERERPALMREPVKARAADVDAILESLNID
jgi:hypothetical protein